MSYLIVLKIRICITTNVFIDMIVKQMKYKVIDNLMDKDDFKNLQSLIMSADVHVVF